MSDAHLAQPGTLNVEQAEILARATEVEAPIPGLPTEDPQAPSGLASAAAAVEQLALSADNLRIYLRAGEKERKGLADALRDAAKAYEEVDEIVEQAINNETTPSSAVTPARANADSDAVALDNTRLAAMPDLGRYADVIQTAWKIEHEGDQGASLRRCAEQWTAYRRSLLAAAPRFRPFAEWGGDAASAAAAALEQHRQWLIHMAELCAGIASQARDVAAAHRKAYDAHISLPKGYLSSQPAVNEPWLRFDHQRLVSMQTYYAEHPEDITMRQQWYAAFVKFQQTSEQVVAEFDRAVEVPPVNPPRPPSVPGSYLPIPNIPDIPSFGGPDNPYGDSPFNGIPSMPTMPSMPPSGPPAMPNDAALADAKAKAGKPTGPMLKPASVGAHGGGLPSMPLQAWGDAEATSRPATAAAGGAGGPKVPAAYAALGKGGAGMPMGGPGAGQGQNNGKGKRPQGGEQALYTEDRPWTAGVIGNRQRHNTADQSG